MDFFLHQSVMLYVLVFVGKTVNNIIATVKMIILNRGERFKAAVLTLVQMSLFILITGSVLAGLTTDFLRIVVYIIAAMLGNYLGTIIEGKIALGLSSIQVIVPQDNIAGGSIAEPLADKLRDEGFAVTILDGEGEQVKRDVLLLHLKRKRIPKAKAIIRAFLENAVIIENEVKLMDGGYIEEKHHTQKRD